MKTTASVKLSTHCPAHRMRRVAALLSYTAISLASTAATAAEALKAELSNPENACFRRGEPVRMTLFAEGFAPGVEAMGDIVVLDAWNRDIERHTLRFTPDETGSWRGEFLLPSDRYGFRRVRVSTASGTKLTRRGSCPAGCITYAVLHSPGERRPIAEEDCFFGLFRDCCGVSRWLGMHHIYGHGSPTPRGRQPPADGWDEYGTVIPGDSRYLNRFATEEERATLKSEFEDRREAFVACRTEEGRRHYASALTRFAAAGREQYPHRRFYEPFLEPELYAKPEEIVAAAEIAHKAIHAGDPDAIVSLPDVCTVTDISTHKKLFALGIGRFMDAFALHPYSPYPPEPSGFLRNIRLLAQMADEAAGRKLIKIATEAGFAAPADKELAQMNGLVRKQLILLGEGWDFSYVFYAHDYANDHGDWHDGDYGVFYNLDMEIPPPGKKPSAESRWHLAHVAPRPAAAALSAASWYLDGYRPVARFDDIGGTALGYAYERRGAPPEPTPSVVLALWDYGTGCEVEISVGREEIVVADIMGEERVVPAPGGVLRLSLGESPQYILDPVLPEREPPVRRMSKGDDPATTASGQQQERPAFAKARHFDTDHVWPIDADTSPDAVAAPGVDGVRLVFGWNERYLAVEAVVDDDVFLQRFTGWDTWKDDSLQIALAGNVLRVGTANFLHDFRTEAYTENTIALTPDGPAIHRTVTWDDETLPAGRGADAVIAPKDAPRTVEILDTNEPPAPSDHGEEKQPRDRRNPEAEQRASQTLGSMAENQESPRPVPTPDAKPMPLPPGFAETPGSKITAGGTVRIRYRAAFPWRFLGRETPPAPGESVWFAACVNDRDTPDGPLSQRHVFDFKAAAPKGFGRILLIP
jgi:hypothetical protein